MRRDAVIATQKRPSEHDSSNSPTQQDTLPGLLHSKNSNIAESGVFQIINAYEEVIFRRPNILKLPKGEERKNCIRLLASEYEKASSRVNTSKVPLITATVMIQCILQRINTNGIASIRKTIQRRLDLWENHKVYELLEEARHLQHESFGGLGLSIPNINVKRENKWSMDMSKQLDLGYTGDCLSALCKE
ncbi:hypothetical protein GJ496_000146 [Pomphorhynchus laevis]|nr:hypothetical protein GJ496_000146 [Pomphorhynchus laevis]